MYRYNGGYLLDVLLLTQAPTVVRFDGFISVYYFYFFNYILRFCFVWWPGIVINVRV